MPETTVGVDQDAVVAYREAVVTEFHRFFYDHIAANKPTWLGHKINKSPLDLWVMAEILYDVKPDVIVECGTGGGGSALFFASVLSIIGNGFVVTVDKQPIEGRPKHARIAYVRGDSSKPTTGAMVKNFIKDASKITDKDPVVLVDLDSNHTPEHVYRELKLWADFVTPESYLIVEDTNISGKREAELGHPVVAENEENNGPTVAVKRFLSERTDFVVDRSRERFLFSYNPGGFLKRTGGAI